MNRIKEHVERRELPSGIQKLKAIGPQGPMPLKQDGQPIGMVEAGYRLGCIMGAMFCRDFVTRKEVQEACEFIKGFDTPAELRAAIWGDQA